MEVSGVAKEYQKDVESLRKQLEERTQSQNQEMEDLRSSTNRQLEDKDKIHEEQTRSYKAKRDTENDMYTRDNRADWQEVADKYERRLEDQRKDTYDKFARQERDNKTARENEKFALDSQINELARAKERETETNRNLINNGSKDSLDRFNGQVRDLQKKYEAELADQQVDFAHERQTRERQLAEHRDKNIKDAQAEIQRDHIGSENKFQKYVNEKMIETDGRQKAAKIREEDLKAKFMDAQTGAGSSVGRTLEENKAMSNANLDSALKEHNRTQEIAKQKYESSLTTHEHDNNLRNFDREMQFKESEKILNNKLKTSEHNFETELAKRDQQNAANMAAQETNLKRTYETSAEVARNGYRDAMNRQRSQSQSNFETRNSEMTNKLAESQRFSNDEIHRTKQDAIRTQTETENKAFRERQNLLRNEQDRYTDLDELRKRQIDGLNAHYRDTVEHTQRKAEHDVTMNTRESQLKLWMANERAKNMTEELETTGRMKHDELENTYNRKSERLKKGYADNINSTKDHYDEISQEQNHDTRMKVARLQTDGDHRVKMQMFDLQAKNRELLEQAEARINQAKDEHEAEFNKLKTETDKQVRETNKRTKEMLDRQQSIHDYQMTAKEKQMDEKLRAQAEAFKEQVDKLRRSNEYSIKKG